MICGTRLFRFVFVSMHESRDETEADWIDLRMKSEIHFDWKVDVQETLEVVVAREQ
jgi:hypothetical protein